MTKSAFSQTLAMTAISSLDSEKKRAIKKAGITLAGNLVWTHETEHVIREVFDIANEWRLSHMQPMRRVRYDLLGIMRKLRIKGTTVARLKRMHSVRKKLRNTTYKLHQIQDLAGCRAILLTMNDVRLLVSSLKQSFRHSFKGESPYIDNPKPDGYRSHHLIFEFCGEGDDASLNGRLIEIQVRTKLQHSWATAVEAVGLFRNEDIKGGQGDPDWRRLFQLMSSEFAVLEGCSNAGTITERKERSREIKGLNKKLNAASMLQNITDSVHYIETYRGDPQNKPDFFLIEYDNETSNVYVTPEWSMNRLSSIELMEVMDNWRKLRPKEAVLAEADRVRSLVRAYPNYFGDVRLFKRRLQEIIHGKNAKEFILCRPRNGQICPPDLCLMPLG